MVKTKYRNLLTGQVLEKTFRSGDKVDEADFERHKGQFLYADGDRGIFMDLETYEQFEMEEEDFAPIAPYLLEGTEVTSDCSRGGWSMSILPHDGGTDGHGNGAGHEKCHRHRPDQGGGPGNRLEAAGPPLSGGRREDQGGHPRRPVHFPGIAVEP